MDQVNTTTDYLSRAYNNIIDGLPEFIGALLVLIISYFVAKGLEKATRKLVTNIHLNERLHSGSGGSLIARALPSPTRLVGSIVFWIVFLFGLSLAIAVLGVPVFNDFLRSVYGYLPNVLAALIIFMVASAISAGVVGLVGNTMGSTPTGKIVATASPTIIMSIAVFMILNQLRIAPAIVTITYTAILGGASLGMALAFGLGGRDVASRILENLYTKGQRSRGQVKADVKTGAANARRRARAATENLT